MRQCVFVAAVAVTVLISLSAARADWPHEVKWNQLDPYSVWLWQSYVYGQEEPIVADDFLCEEAGWITDIEFYGFCSNSEALTEFRITFWDNVAATPDEASHPGERLGDAILVSKADPSDSLKLGWQVFSGDRFKINLPRKDWFEQQEGTTYWIGIQGVLSDDTEFGWRFRDSAFPTSTADAVSSGLFSPLGDWRHLAWRPDMLADLYSGTLPEGYQSADMAFSLSGIPIPEPASCVLVISGAALIAALRRRPKT